MIHFPLRMVLAIGYHNRTCSHSPCSIKPRGTSIPKATRDLALLPHAHVLGHCTHSPGAAPEPHHSHLLSAASLRCAALK